jgi:hypothetical protein
MKYKTSTFSRSLPSSHHTHNFPFSNNSGDQECPLPAPPSSSKLENSTPMSVPLSHFSHIPLSPRTIKQKRDHRHMSQAHSSHPISSHHIPHATHDKSRIRPQSAPKTQRVARTIPRRTLHEAVTYPKPNSRATVIISWGACMSSNVAVALRVRSLGMSLQRIASHCRVVM